MNKSKENITKSKRANNSKTISSSKDKKNNTKEKKRKSTTETFVLPSIVDITCVISLHKDLSKVAETKKDFFILDASKVEKITTPAIQVILALFKKLEERNINYSLLNMAEAFEASFNDLGLGKKLEQWAK